VGAKADGNHKVGDIVGIGPMRNCCDECNSCKKGIEVYCTKHENKFLYGENFGGYSTKIHIRGKFAFKIPEKLDLSKAAPLLCAGVTVYVPLRDSVKKGDKVGVIAIGGLGHLAVQYARKMGASVYAFTTSTGKEEFIKGLGADHVVTYSDKDF
jgi:D-arabinose 1-dehydrogenase-like Zn-dependent alcohol dehydrogenase